MTIKSPHTRPGHDPTATTACEHVYAETCPIAYAAEQHEKRVRRVRYRRMGREFDISIVEV